MAEKHRFKKEREFKKRLSEQEENEEADIRSFKFHSLERKASKDFKGARDSKDGRKSREFKDFKDSRDFRDSKKKFNKGGQDFGRKNRKFNHEED